MRSKKSKKILKTQVQSTATSVCFDEEGLYSEFALKDWAKRFVKTLPKVSMVWFFLEGPMGAGKSTLARFMLEALGVDFKNQSGSPSFPILFEYRTQKGTWVHADLYRLKTEAEIETAGVEDVFFRSDVSGVICEWGSLFHDFQARLENLSPVLRTNKVAYRIQMDYDPKGDEKRRQIQVRKLF
jgi:tRNA threonylcarbamoyl adenosine modification protein YjeE